MGQLAEEQINNLREQLLKKDTMISNLQEQVARYRCQQVKNQQLINALQQKITKLTPSLNNTASSFMMPSEFKDHFETCMTSMVPSALAALIDRPKLFSQCFSDIVVKIHHSIRIKLNEILSGITNVLGLRIDQAESKIKISILKILQENWQYIFAFQEMALHYTDNSGQFSSLLEQLNEIVREQDYTQLQQQLHRLCVYMILQQKEWEWMELNSQNQIKYSKKECTCMDGWVKEEDNVLLVLGGIQRDGKMHANLKQFVVPLSDEEETQSYHTLQLQTKSIQQPTNLISETEAFPSQQAYQVPLNLVLNQSSRNLQQSKQNIPALIKKQKKKDKNKYSLDQSLNCMGKDELKHTKILDNSTEEKIAQIKEDTLQIRKNITINKKVNFELEEHIKLTKNQDLPVSREKPLHKRPKPSTSRKNSVGKIVSQGGCEKQNSQSWGNAKLKAKERCYKDFIREKLLEDRANHKTKAERVGKKQDTRPLKLHGNANKLRQKYLY